MKVTIDEAAKILKCSKANVYQQIKKHGVKVETEMRQLQYETTRSVRKQVFELEDLAKAKGAEHETSVK